MEREKDLLLETEAFLSKYEKPEIDAVAVTVGPGLDPCLWVGVNFAKTLACAYNIPLIPVNHIKAHILSFLLCEDYPVFPAVALIVSGGHTELVLINSLQDFVSLGKTRDDAAGECFDKTARLLGLPYPGGPEITKQAKLFKEKKFNISLPRPMAQSDNYDFSFSGLKTAVLYDFRSREDSVQKNPDYIAEMANEIERAITDTLVSKLVRAAKEYNVKSVILGGGVSANETLRKEAVERVNKEMGGVKIIIPPLRLSTDNAEMIAATAAAIGKGTSYEKAEVDANLKICDRI